MAELIATGAVADSKVKLVHRGEETMPHQAEAKVQGLLEVTEEDHMATKDPQEEDRKVEEWDYRLARDHEGVEGITTYFPETTYG
jgi:hypothetical protein